MHSLLSKSKMWLWLMSIMLSLCCTVTIYAMEKHNHKTTALHNKERPTQQEEIPHAATSIEHKNQNHQTAETHSSNNHHTQPPGIYYLYWILLGILFCIGSFYALWVHKRGRPEHEDLSLAVFLVLLVIILYTLGQLPQLQRHFDHVSSHFVNGYHEPNTAGFIKFIYKIMVGVLLMIYGLIGRQRH